MAPYRARRRIRNPIRATTTSATATTATATTTDDDDDDGDHSNNKNQESPQYSTTTTSEGLSKNGDGRDFDALEEDDLAATTTPSGCCYSTPKAKRFRIPKISKCPPAPRKKQRLLPSNICSLRRSKPIAFFAPPDLELFFFFALPDIAV